MFFMNVNLLSHHSLELTGYHSEFNINGKLPKWTYGKNTPAKECGITKRKWKLTELLNYRFLKNIN